MDIQNRIVVDPAIMVGKPIIRVKHTMRTRIETRRSDGGVVAMY